MSNSDRCVLTAKDFSILDAMKERCLVEGNPLAEIIRRKLAGACVTFADDVPADIVTLNSRVTYRVDGGAPDTRIIAHGDMRGSVGMLLTISNPRGLALLGLAEGESFTFGGQSVPEQTVTVEAVIYQPEAAKRDARRMAESPQARTFTGLRLVHSVDRLATEPAKPWRPQGPGSDDPGPSAA
jgi:regulator of nucleoside diphosphate kinase